jgi:hypothetical protein
MATQSCLTEHDRSALAARFGRPLARPLPRPTLQSRFNEELKPNGDEPITIEGEIAWTDKELTHGEVGYVERESGLVLFR